MSTRIQKFSDFHPINETVQNAKAFLLKFAAQEANKKRKTPEGEKIKFTPEEEKKILNNPDYIEVRDYFLNVAKKPGLVYPFTYFRIAEGLPMTCGNEGDTECFSVINLSKKLEEVNPLLSNYPLPLGNIDNYIKRKDPNDNRPAYEKLWDDIENILSQRPIKQFIDRFVGPIRREFAESLKLRDTDTERSQLLDRIYHSVLDIKKLKPLFNPVTKEEETAEDQLVNNASKYKDTRTYPDFKDTYIAFKEFVRDLEEKVSAWGKGITEFINELESISPSIKILYYNPAKSLVVTSARSGEGMRSVCKIANATYCIRDNSTFWRYTSGKLQISFSKLDLPKTDLKYLTSLTIDPTGKVTDSANRENRPITSTGINYKEVLNNYGIYDSEAIESIERNFSSELSIKNLIEKFEKKSGDKSKKDMILAFGSFSLQQDISSGDYNKEEIDQYKDLMVQIIKSDYTITYKDIVSAFMDGASGGFFTMDDVKLFEILTDNNYENKDVRDILDLTEAGASQLPGYLEQLQSQKTLDSRIISMVKEIIRIHPEIKSYVEGNML